MKTLDSMPEEVDKKDLIYTHMNDVCAKRSREPIKESSSLSEPKNESNRTKQTPT